MPGGALLYLQADDFSRLLSEWKASKVKADWLACASYDVFSHSNLFSKLSGVYDAYARAAGFSPDLNGVLEIAGGQSALALYGIRDVEFLYITRVTQSRLAQCQLWRVRSKFEERQSAGIPFYWRSASGNTVAFAFTDGYLFVATRDDLVAQALALYAGAKEPSVASARWYEDATQAATAHGELRLVLNLEALIKSTYFRSYWVHRNVSTLRQYSAAIADMTRDPRQIMEHRVLLRSADSSTGATPDSAREALGALLPLVPEDAGLYKAWAVPPPDFAATLIEEKLLAPQVQVQRDWRYAPPASGTGEAAGAESDLETRIDEPSLPAESTGLLVTGPLRKLLEEAQITALLQVQSSAQMRNGFVSTPSVLALAAASEWNGSAVKEALAQSIETLWTTARLGAQWVPANARTQAIERLDGLAPLMFAIRGRILFLANDADLLAAVLDRPASSAPAAHISYGAQFRHSRERGDYDRLMRALDFAQTPQSPTFGFAAVNAKEPRFFSENLGSLSRVLSFVNTISATRSDEGKLVKEQIVYEIRP